MMRLMNNKTLASKLLFLSCLYLFGTTSDWTSPFTDPVSSSMQRTFGMPHLFAAADDSRENIQNDLKNVACDTAGAVKDGVGVTSASIKDAYHDASDAINEAAQKAKENLYPQRAEEEKGLWEKMKEMAGSTKDCVKVTASDAKDAVKDAAENAKDTAEEKYHDVKEDKIIDAAQGVKEDKGLWEKVKETFSFTKEDTASNVKDTTVKLAAGTGKDTVDEKYDDVKEKVIADATKDTKEDINLHRAEEDTWEKVKEKAGNAKD